MGNPVQLVIKFRKFISFTLIILISICFTVTSKAYAGSDLSVTALGSPVKSGDFIFQDLSLSLKTKHNWQLIVTPLNGSLINTSHPSSRISIGRLTVQDEDTNNTYSLKSNKPMVISSGNDVDKFDKKITLKFINSDADYPGTYTANLQFTLLTSTGSSSDIYTLQITQPEVRDIYVTPNTVDINISSENSQLSSFSQESTTATKLYIHSNRAWKLILNGLNNKNLINYAFKVTSNTGSSKVYYNTDYTSLPYGSFIIAEGAPTVSSNGADLEPQIIEVNYRIKTDKANNLSAGSYPFNIRYDLISN